MAWMHHPDDEPTPRFGNHWSNDFNTYADACRFFGCDTPAQMAAEQADYDAEEATRQAAFIGPRQPVPAGDEIPF